MKKLSYLLFNLLILTLPIISKLIYQKTILPKTSYFILSAAIVAVIFIVWDIKVTDKWWFFNNRYILGVKFFKLPIEEVLFFFTVPYSCLVIFLNLDYLIKSKVYFNLYYPLTIIFIILSFYFLKNKKPYPFFVFLFLSVNILFDYLLKVNLLNKVSFHIYIIFVLFLTLIFNFFLTSKKIVTYSNSYKTNFLVTTIPFEDFIYGINLLYLNLTLYLLFQRIF